MTARDGGPAFPNVESDPEEWNATGKPWAHTYSYGGMSLRDWFAGQALHAIVETFLYRSQQGYAVEKVDFRICSELAYELADAMLKARE
jgi:hypothetical protein